MNHCSYMPPKMEYESLLLSPMTYIPAKMEYESLLLSPMTYKPPKMTDHHNIKV